MISFYFATALFSSLFSRKCQHEEFKFLADGGNELRSAGLLMQAVQNHDPSVTTATPSSSTEVVTQVPPLNPPGHSLACQRD